MVGTRLICHTKDYIRGIYSHCRNVEWVNMAWIHTDTQGGSSFLWKLYIPQSTERHSRLKLVLYSGHWHTHVGGNQHVWSEVCTGESYQSIQSCVRMQSLYSTCHFRLGISTKCCSTAWALQMQHYSDYVTLNTLLTCLNSAEYCKHKQLWYMHFQLVTVSMSLQKQTWFFSTSFMYKPFMFSMCVRVHGATSCMNIRTVHETQLRGLYIHTMYLFGD